MNQFDLQGRRAVITGGAQGIGFAVAERLAASGARVSVWDVDEQLAASAAEKLSAGSGTHQGLGVDVSQPASVEAAVKATVNHLGAIEILVANAGIAGPNLKTWEYPIEAWQQVIDIDLTGVFLCCRAVAPLMIAQKYGRIVNTASIAGKEGNPNAPAYSAAKAGVIALTKSLGKELAAYDIAVNCITRRRRARASSISSLSSILTTCCRRFPADASLKSRRSPPWSPGWCRRRTRSQPARFSISVEDGLRIDGVPENARCFS